MTDRDDPYRLQRFVLAQDDRDTYATALLELRAGRKATHWMWFVFPQIAGLGYSDTARRYAISSLAEAREYLGHPVLGPRLTECARVLTQLSGSTAREIFGALDAQKLHSSMTLFAHAAADDALFRQVLTQYFAGREDPGTTARL